MTRTERASKSNHNTHKRGGGAAARRSEISRSITKLLRHQAENEKVPITPAGWIKLDDLITWRGLQRIASGITVAEVFEVIEEDGRTGKGRFAVKHVGEAGIQALEMDKESKEDGAVDVDGAATGDMVNAMSALSIEPQASSLALGLETQPQPHIDPKSKNTPETQTALHHLSIHPETPASHYLIRANQGHSIKSIQSADLLTPITLSDPSSIPDTVVHGTFYGAWPAILSSGGLKPMGRNNVHFGTGPSLSEVLEMIDSPGTDQASTPKGKMKTKSQVDEVLSRNKVISGMRWDAQLLIYIDLKACLEDVAARGLDMSWWISGNGVVLTEGVVLPPDSDSDSQREPQPRSEAQVQPQTQPRPPPQQPPPTPPNDNDDVPIIASKHAKAQKATSLSVQPTQTTPHPHPQPPNPKQHTPKHKTSEKLVPMRYWSTVIEIKNGVGVIWTREGGMVKELPERLRRMPLPQGKRKHAPRPGLARDKDDKGDGDGSRTGALDIRDIRDAGVGGDE